ncbi:MAG: hypothetical protein KAI47_15200, partial [Deltaproteobacteria bacterium]|nr:hypothetical protein [Deltaproteobacteria bacterium]
DTLAPDTLAPDTLAPDTLAPDTTPTPDSAPPACALSGNHMIGKATTGSIDFTSFAAAFAKLKSCGVSGPTTFTVKTGTYTEAGFQFPVVPYASPSAQVSFIAQGTVKLVGRNTTHKAIVTIEAGAHDLILDGFEIDGLDVDNTPLGSYGGPVIFGSGGNQKRITLRNLYIHDFVGATAWSSSSYIGAIYAQVSSTSRIDDLLIEGCRFHRIAPPASFHTQGAICFRYGTRINVTISRCEFFDINKMPAIEFRAGTHRGITLVANNMFVLGDGQAAIKLYSSPILANDLQVAFNSMFTASTTSSGITGSVSSTSTGSVVAKNNILKGPSANTKVSLISGMTSHVSEDHNCLGNAVAGLPTPSVNDIIGVATFFDTVGPTYNLHSSNGSPCLDKAKAMPGVVDVDFDGVARSTVTPDIGADERN